MQRLKIAIDFMYIHVYAYKGKTSAIVIKIVGNSNLVALNNMKNKRKILWLDCSGLTGVTV